MFVLREWADAGGLLSYGASFSAMFRRAAEYVDKIPKEPKRSIFRSSSPQNSN